MRPGRDGGGLRRGTRLRWRRGLQVRGETSRRLALLAAGGLLLGAGGRIGGGCNLGHGLSGTAQLGVSSWLAVACMAVGVLLASAVGSWLGARGATWQASRLSDGAAAASP